MQQAFFGRTISVCLNWEPRRDVVPTEVRSLLRAPSFAVQLMYLWFVWLFILFCRKIWVPLHIKARKKMFGPLVMAGVMLVFKDVVHRVFFGGRSNLHEYGRKAFVVWYASCCL